MEFSFSTHVTMLERFLDRGRHIVEEIESRALNVQGRRGFPLGEPHYIEDVLTSCFYDSAPRELAGLKGQLSSAHWANGFEPVQQERGAHDFNSARLVAFAHAYWATSRWPGRNGRMAYAQTIYSVFVLTQLQLLSLRVWDGGDAGATARWREIQSLLDRLNEQPGSPVFVRTAPWLLQTAQGPLTRLLQPYFTVADHISQSFADDDRIQIHRAGTLLAGGHLRSQLRYRSRESQRSIDDPEILSVTRNSNSMDVALLIRDLVPLLEAYKAACLIDARDTRQTLSAAILQGLSADPELLLTRLDVLGPATMIEEVFIERKEDGGIGHTEFGTTHRDALSKFRNLICDLAQPLEDDAQHLDPGRQVYSPFAVVYGFCADILSNMAIARLTSPTSLGPAIEDMFSSDVAPDSKLATARQWEALPRDNPERARFEYSAEWATEIFNRLVTALRQRAQHGDSANASGIHNARLFVVREGHSGRGIAGNATTACAQEHCITSDLKRALDTGATAFPRSQILSDRREGRFLASVELEGKWFAVSKVLLTTCLCQGKDALLADVPAAAIDILRLTCPEFVEIGSQS